jgi:hypothetical protein
LKNLKSKPSTGNPDGRIAGLDWIAEGVLKMAPAGGPMANGRHVSFKLKSLEVGTLKTLTFQRSSVQPTIAISDSESISYVNISFCA